MAEFSKQYTVLKRLAAVKLDECTHAHGAVTTIAVDSIITLAGPSRLPGMVEVQWNGTLYAVFAQDLQEKSQSVKTVDSGGLPI